MREFQEKKRFRKFLYSKTMACILIVLILFFTRATWGVYKKQRETAANAMQAQNALQRLEDRQALLDREITKLKTDEGVEEEIRSKYGVSKPGEQVLIIVDTEKATSTQEELRQTWWDKVRGLFR
jgi:cell division protein FtsB